MLDDPRGHLHHASEPETPVETQRRAFGEAWAALSVGLLIVAARGHRLVPDPAAGRRDRPVLLGSVPRDRGVLRPRRAGSCCCASRCCLAFVSAVILAVTFIREVVLVGLLGLGVLLIADNLGELRRRAS